MHSIRRTIPAWSAALLLIFPLAMAHADDPKGGAVDVPAPRSDAGAVVPVTPPPAEKPVAAAPPPWVTLSSTSIAVGIGASWGDGTLNFEGEKHAFALRGLSVLDVGASVTDALGEVHNLESLADFEGTYVAIEAAGALGAGASTTRMRNEKGVEIALRAELQGVELALAAQGFRISLK